MVGERLARRRNLRSRRRGGLLQFLLVVVVLAGGAVAVALFDRPGEAIAGVPHVADGDTITIGRQRIRLVGIDAPELDQLCKDAHGAAWPCGKSARQSLSGLVAGKRLACTPEGRDKYGRTLARCRAGNIDLGAAMVDAGMAVSYGDYQVRETMARLGGKGIWAGSFETPQAWRRTHGAGEEGFDPVDWLLGLFRR